MSAYGEEGSSLWTTVSPPGGSPSVLVNPESGSAGAGPSEADPGLVEADARVVEAGVTGAGGEGGAEGPWPPAPAAGAPKLREPWVVSFLFLISSPRALTAASSTPFPMLLIMYMPIARALALSVKS